MVWCIIICFKFLENNLQNTKGIYIEIIKDKSQLFFENDILKTHFAYKRAFSAQMLQMPHLQNISNSKQKKKKKKQADDIYNPLCSVYIYNDLSYLSIINFKVY